jgi:hypothetical protein
MNSKSINKSQINTARKACCKVCQDAGKPENVYLSHYVKDLNGNVTCPTLLSQECRYCHKKGHTTSHCSALKKQKEHEENSRKPPLSPQKKETVEKKANVFAYLDMSSDDESDNEQEQFPELAAASQPKDPFEKEKNTPKKFSYASMAAKTVEEKKPLPIVQQQLKIEFTPRYVKGIDTKTGKKFSWADAESSSDEEEEENEYFEDPFEDNISSLAEDNSAW